MSKTRKALGTTVDKPRQWGQPSKPHQLPQPWFGLDTERDALVGNFVCGFAANGVHTQEFTTLQELIAGTYWVWNLAYDIEGMVRDLDQDNGWAMKADGAPFTIGDAKCTYFHGKRFDWKDGDGRRIFLEASSFFGRQGLDKVARNVIQDTKRKKGVDAKTMSLERYWRDPVYKMQVDDYCIQDARLAWRLVDALNTGVIAAGEKLGVRTALGATPGATARKFLSSVGAFPEIIWRNHRSFLRSYCGGRFEIVKRGYFERVYQYDITSAYVWALSKCPFLTETATQHFTRRFSDDALYGSYEVGFATDEYLGIAPGWRGNTRVYSNAEEKVWLARPEVEWLLSHGYDVKIHKGVEIRDPNATDAWERTTVDLFNLKQSGKGRPEGMGAKTIAVSLYGVIIQLVPKSGEWVPLLEAKNPIDFVGDLALEAGPDGFTAGKYYAPIYAGHLTSLTRVLLLDAARLAGEKYIGGHTDSVLSQKRLPELEALNGLGGWDLEGLADELVITKTGMYAMDDKVKSRGIDRDLPKEILWAPHHTRKLRVGIKTAKEWSDVSLIKEKPVANNLDLETKRIWNAPFSRETIERKEWIDSESVRYVY